MRSLLRVLLLASLLFAGAAIAQAIEPLPFKDHAEELRYQHLTAQLRCPMCQNETLADKQYLVDRYSEFVLYDPPVARNTWLLWFGPLLILLVGAGVVVATIRKRSRAVTPATSPALNTLDEGDDW